MLESEFNAILQLADKCAFCCRQCLIFCTECGKKYTQEEADELFARNFYDIFLAPKCDYEFFEMYKNILGCGSIYLAFLHFFDWLRSKYSKELI